MDQVLSKRAATPWGGFLASCNRATSASEFNKLFHALVCPPMFQLANLIIFLSVTPGGTILRLGPGTSPMGASLRIRVVSRLRRGWRRAG